MRLLLTLTLLLLLAMVGTGYADTLTVQVDRDNGSTQITDKLVLNPANLGAAPAVTGVDFYPAADDQHAAIEIDQTIHTSTDDRQGAIHATTTGPDSHTGAAANWFEYIATGALTGGFDLASTHIMRADNISGGTAGAQWWVAATPSTNTGPWQVYGGEINILNRYADNGYQEAAGSNAKGTYGLFMVPEGELNLGLGTQRGYNVSGGIVFTRSLGSDYGDARTYPAAKTWTPLWIDRDAIAPGGTGLLTRGGSTTGNAPAAAIKIKDYQGIGLDTSTATFSGPAIKLGGGQTISDNAGNSVTVAQLATAVGGGATDSDAIHKSGIGEIDAVSAKAAPVAGDYLLIEDSEAGKVKKKVQLGNLPVPTSVAKLNAEGGLTLNGSDWTTGTGTVSAIGLSTLTANTTGAFASLKAGAVIKFSSNTESSVLSVTGDTASLAQGTNVSAVTWSYRNPAVTWQANGSNVGFLESNGTLEILGDGYNGPKIYTHSWGVPGGVVGFTAGGTPSSPVNTPVNTILNSAAGGGLTSNAGWVVGAGVQFKSGENWGTGIVGSGSGSYILFNTTANNVASQSEKARIDGNGRFGINTTAPTAMLHVKGKTTAQEVTYTRAGASDGLRDLTATGTYTGPGGDTYTVIIDATGTPDTFKWKKNSGSYTTGVAATGSNQTLSDGVQIKLAATTGHTLNDQWVISMPVPLEIDNASGTALVTVDNNGMTTEKLADYTASFTVAGSTNRVTLATGTATVTLPKTLPAGTTSVLVTVAGAAASGVSFAAESGGSLSWGDAGSPTFTNSKTADVVCTSENATATTAAAWRCVKGGNF